MNRQRLPRLRQPQERFRNDGDTPGPLYF